MKVQDLIKTLSSLPPQAEAVVDGYEGGCDTVVAVKKLAIRKAEKTEWYNGEYEAVQAGAPGALEAVIILGNRRTG
jgi:hypothetical protein